MIKQLLLFRTLVFVTLVILSFRASATTFTVTNLNNTGAGSLRQAITNANSAGAGGHLIDFSLSGTIVISSNLPKISNNHITIDGIGQSIVVAAGNANANRYIFRGNANADFLTIRNLELKNTSYQPFTFDGSPTDVTIENIKWFNESGNYINYGIYYGGNALNLTVKNVIAEDHQNYGAVLEITGTAIGLMVDNLTFDNTLSDHRKQEVIRVAKVATNITIKNCDWNLDSGVSTDDSDYGMFFASNVSNLNVTDVNILNCEVYPVYIAGTSNLVKINRFASTNGPGYGGAFGMRFQGAASNYNLDTISLDLDHTTSTDDGNYGIYFGSTTTNINIDSLVIHDAEVYGIYFGGVASRDTILRATIDNFDGGTTQQGIHFHGGANNILIEDVVLNGDVNGTTNNGDYGLWFNSDATSNITLTNLSITNYNVDGIWFYEVDNLNISNSEFSNCQDGIEFHNNDDRANNVITNSIFDNNSRSGIIINVANATSEFNLDSNVFSNNTNYGVWLYSSGGLKNIQITNNTIFGNGTSGIYNERADGVLYSSNSIYNNPIGIDNYSTDGNNGLINPGKVPVLLSSVDVGGGNFDVEFTLPTLCNTGDCDVEFFTNNVGDGFLNGRDYINVSSSLGTGTHTATLNSAGNTSGFWTATLKVSSLNNSVSEFSKPLVIKPKFPAGVSAGIALWMSADEGVTDAGTDITEWTDRAGIHTPIFYSSDPDLLEDEANLINFNPTVDFDGNDYIRWDGDLFYNSFTAGEVFTVIQEEGIGVTSHNGYPFDFGGGNGSRYTYGNQYIYDDFGSSDRKVWRPNNGAPSYTEGTASGATLSGPVVNTLDYNIYNVLSETNNWQSAFNGVTAITDVTNTVNFTGTPHLGARSGAVWYGRLPEIVFYNRVLDLDERQRINSYLAIKYGKTLGHNYYASDWNGTTGTTLWTIGGGYDNDIAGIARDDDGTLLQKQSKSINDDAIVAIYNTDQSASLFVSNQASTASPTVDNSALLWGNNDSTASFSEFFTPTTFTPPPPSSFFHMKRVWKVAETGTIGNVTLVIPSTIGADYVLVHNSSDFSTGTPIEIPLLSDGNGNNYIVYDFTDGQYFTFGANKNYPGGVAVDLVLWLKADIGVTEAGNVDSWLDISSETLFSQGTASRKPNFTLGDAGTNFNPTILFTRGTGDELVTPNNTLFPNTEGSVIVAASNSAFTGYQSLFNISDDNYGFGARNNDFYMWDVSNGTSVNSTFKYILNQSHIATLNYDAGGYTKTLDGVTENGYGGTPGVQVGAGIDITIGGQNPGNQTWNGSIPEVIGYARNLSAQEQERVNTYMAIKYGVTLAHNYYASDWDGSTGTTIWDATTNAAYSNDIAGIGRDDVSGLTQEQSKSDDADALVTMGLGTIEVTNLQNTNIFPTNKSFLVWGNNDAAITYTVAYPSNPFVTLMSRTWKVKETGTVGIVTISVNESNADVLIVDADGDFTDGNSIEIALENGEITYDFADGDYFTFGTLECKVVNTIACATTYALDLTTYVSNYEAGGTWSETTLSGADLSDPSAIDMSTVALGTYTFKYTGPGMRCNTVNVERLTTIPTPIVDDILICEGGVTNITIPAAPDRVEVLYQESFDVSQGYIIRSRCTGSSSANCYTDDQYKLANVGLKLDAGTNFSAWYSKWWSRVAINYSQLRFYRMRDQEISLSTDSVLVLLPGESANFSGDSRRLWGRMEASDYVKFLYVVDGVETEFANRVGTISTTFQTSSATYTNTTGSSQTIALRVKVKNSYDEAHIVDNLMISKILAPPVFTFYSDAALTTSVATGLSYDPLTAPGTIDTVYVTRIENGCESLPDVVTVEVSPNSVTAMFGEEAFYCAGGTTIDLTAFIGNYQAGGTWTDDDGTAVVLSDPTAVDVSSLSDGSYNFSYILNGTAPCNGEEAMVTVHVGLKPSSPVLEDITVCEGGSTVLSVTPGEDEQEVLYDQPFNGYNGGYNLWSRCTADDVSTCRKSDLAKFTNRGLTVDTSATDFSKWTTWYTWVYDYGNLRFGRLMDEEVVLSTDSFSLLGGEVANFYADSRRYFGKMEAGDYVKFFYVVDGVETEFASREGNISTGFATSTGSYENGSILPVNVQLRVKVKNSYGEAHILDNFKITKTLNKPVNNFYSDAALTNLLATGDTYDPATTVGNIDTIYVTSLMNTCESDADTVIVEVQANGVAPMEGGIMEYCGASSVDLTSLVTTYVIGGVWTDVDGSGVDLSDSTDVDFSGLANGTYNFSYSLSGNCSVEEAIVTISIGLLGAEPYVINDGSIATALTECVNSGWIYFIDPSDDNRRIAAINTNGNTISPSAFSVTVDVDAPATDLERVSGSGVTGKAVELMKRQVQINCPTCVNLSPAVDVRLYWGSTEKVIAGVKMDTLMLTNTITGTKSWQWFKVSHDISDIPANFDANGISDLSGNGKTWSAPSSSGTESNAVEYVQFDGITDFSTFGGGWFVNQPDASVLPIDLLSFSATPIENEYIHLNWQTATEINNAGFELQRSMNGIDFKKLKWIEGSGNTSEVINYQFDDFDVTTNTYYYRLRQVDFNGNYSFTEIKSASILNAEVGFDAILVPNPSSGPTKIFVYSEMNSTIDITIINNYGKLIFSDNTKVIKGENHLNIDVDLIADGFYNVILNRKDGESIVLKWIVIK